MANREGSPKLELLNEKLRAFKQRYHALELIKGTMLFFGVAVILLMTVATLEYFGRFNSTVRMLMFWIALSALVLLLIRYFLVPGFKLLGLRGTLKNEQAAQILAKHFPNIDDKILSAYQLNVLEAGSRELIEAAIEQRTNELGKLDFTAAVDFNELKRLWPVLAIPSFLLIGLLLSQTGNEILGSSTRVVQYKTDFKEPAPFKFVILNDPLEVTEGEDAVIKLKLTGEEIPGEVRMNYRGRLLRMIKKDEKEFELRLNNVSQESELYFQAGGYKSKVYKLLVRNPPRFKGSTITVLPPSYTELEAKTYQSFKNIKVPEGSNVTWYLGLEKDSEASIVLDTSEWAFESNKVSKRILRDISYELRLANRDMEIMVGSTSSVKVVEDKPPLIEVQSSFVDSLGLLRYRLSLADDYGVSRLEQIVKYQSFQVKIGRDATNKAGVWRVPDSLMGQKLDIVFRVWDNDAVNGPKYTDSRGIKVFSKSQGQKELEARSDLDSIAASYQQELSQRESLQESIEDAENTLRSETKEAWQKREKLKGMMKKLEELNERTRQRRQVLKKSLEELSKSDSIKELDAIKELTEQEKEIEKLKEEIEELMKEMDQKALQDKLERLKQENRQQLRREERQERLLEDLMKQKQMLEGIKKMKEAAEKLDSLAKESGKSEQEEQSEAEREWKDGIQNLQDLANEDQAIEEKMGSEEFKKAEEKVQEGLQESQEQMNKGQNENEAQEKASEGAKDMAQQMESMMMEMQMKSLEMNMETLRQILENLQVYSHEVEASGERIRELEQGDPQFRLLLQRQNRLSLGLTVIKDSLEALAEKAPEVSEKVFDELDKMQRTLDGAKSNLQEQRTNQAAAEHQFSMMAANELSLLLDKSMQQMQSAMAMQKKGQQKCQKPGGSKPKPGQMSKKVGQQGQKMQRLKEGKKPGKGQRGINGKELVELIKEQEALRRMLQEMAEKEGQGGNGLKQDTKAMEEIEEQLMRGEVNEEMIERMKKIQSRLLEHEKAELKQKTEEKREAVAAEDLEQLYQKALEDYLGKEGAKQAIIRYRELRLNEFYEDILINED